MKIEVDSYVINEKELAEIVKAKAINHHIPMVYYGEDLTMEDEYMTIEQIKQMVQLQETHLSRVEACCEISEMPIISIRPVIGPVIVFAKKVFRKLTRWLFLTYINQQNEYNKKVLEMIKEVQSTQKMLINYLVNVEKDSRNLEGNNDEN